MPEYNIYPHKEQEKFLEAFLQALEIPFIKEDEELPPHVLAGIARGQADFEAGRTLTLEEFKKRNSIK